MHTQTQAQIYVADQRGYSQIDFFRSLHSFNFGQYTDESRKPFGALQVLNDDLLQAGHSVRMQVDESTQVVLLPVVGGLEYKSDVGNGFLDAGQVQILALMAGMSYEIINPYETELINYLVIWLTDTTTDFRPGSQHVSFDLQTKNELLPLGDIAADTLHKVPVFQGFIGRYEGRQDGIYRVKPAANGVQAAGVFVFILSGAFEVQNRLLHERDGLALLVSQQEEVEFEALSNDAILVVMEIPLNR